MGVFSGTWCWTTWWNPGRCSWSEPCGWQHVPRGMMVGWSGFNDFGTVAPRVSPQTQTMHFPLPSTIFEKRFASMSSWTLSSWTQLRQCLDPMKATPTYTNQFNQSLRFSPICGMYLHFLAILPIHPGNHEATARVARILFQAKGFSMERWRMTSTM